jgi:hypothetical protein
MVAAATTSLPETPGGERNWDYRYSWIRDSTFMLWGLYTLGFDWEANDFFYFIADVAGKSGEDLQVMYGVGGERKLDEVELGHLDGYENARPVRIGNGAYTHRQHDVWGTILDSFYLHTKSRDGLPDRFWPILCQQVEEAITHWREPDRGIWEVRGEPQHFTSSKIMCWVACDRGARLARLREEDDMSERWQKVADEIHADVLANGLDERGVFTQHYGSEALDASLLLAPLVRFLPPDDERIVNTVKAIADELTVDGLVLRYRVEETDDGMQGEEGAFAICSFWLVSALAEIGEHRHARELCEKLLGYASPLGLYAEEIEPRSGRHLGNFPQAFTHLALINAVMHVIRADHELTMTQQPLDAAPRHALRRPTGGPGRGARDPATVCRRRGAPPRARPHGQPHQRRAARDRGHIAVAGGSTPRAPTSCWPDAGTWAHVHLWLGDERASRRPPGANQRMIARACRSCARRGPAPAPVRGELTPEDAAWLYATEIAPRDGGEPVFDLVLLGWGRTGTRRRCSPATLPPAPSTRRSYRSATRPSRRRSASR